VPHGAQIEHIVVVDDEPDVEEMFRQQFRRDLRSGRFVMEFARSAPAALQQVKAIPDPSLIVILSDINMPGISGLEMLPKVKGERPNVPVRPTTSCRRSLRAPDRHGTGQPCRDAGRHPASFLVYACTGLQYLNKEIIIVFRLPIPPFETFSSRRRSSLPGH
jgi:CheY-like chemotaxis protein